MNQLHKKLQYYSVLDVFKNLLEMLIRDGTETANSKCNN